MAVIFSEKELQVAREELKEAASAYRRALDRVESLERQQCRVWTDKMADWAKDARRRENAK